MDAMNEGIAKYGYSIEDVEPVEPLLDRLNTIKYHLGCTTEEALMVHKLEIKNEIR